MAEVIPRVFVCRSLQSVRKVHHQPIKPGLLGSDYPGPVSDYIIHSVNVQCKHINRKLFFFWI